MRSEEYMMQTSGFEQAANDTVIGIGAITGFIALFFIIWTLLIITLFFKIWSMTNDVGKIRELLEDHLDQEASQVDVLPDETVSSERADSLQDNIVRDAKTLSSGISGTVIALSIVAGVLVIALIVMIQVL